VVQKRMITYIRYILHIIHVMCCWFLVCLSTCEIFRTGPGENLHFLNLATGRLIAMWHSHS
jgi:hypothetical protein